MQKNEMKNAKKKATAKTQCKKKELNNAKKKTTTAKT